MRQQVAIETGGGDQVAGLQIVIVQSDGQITATVGGPPMIEFDPLVEPELESPGR
jgi:hypothetical protein